VTYPKSLILLDNFRIGGLERLALDQLFTLSDLGVSASAYYRQVDMTLSLPNFLSLEKDRIAEKGIVIRGLPKSDMSQVFRLARFFKDENIELVINHSIGAGVITRLASIISGREVVIKTFVHQLPSLSAPIQRVKRFTYALVSDEVFGYSVAVVKDWNSRIHNTFLPKFIKSKLEINLIRNGIYLGRLPKVISSHGRNHVPRLIFIGRNVAWKNLNLVIELLRHESLKFMKALIVLPSIDAKFQENLESRFSGRIEFAIGKTIESLSFTDRDINIYPVNYGANAKYIESISLNCLEMACLGIPSLVTRGGNETWPDLVSLDLLHEVDWDNRQEVVNKISELSENRFSESTSATARELISVKKNLMQILRD